ncbi:hypothetical protein NQ317_015334 [Molorchus minor]|uniref:Ig-like domain-containing protein n=1 Tax=Molorchus minor TaxID=1323400 RepID=A0ABQ9JD03_9CUCU|nr:hypothetical protein NQ317_015334 [Molorchus minor]
MVVTVSDSSFIAPPRENPRIEGLTASYKEGDTLLAKCISDLADPAPILTWYINGQPAIEYSLRRLMRKRDVQFTRSFWK